MMYIHRIINYPVSSNCFVIHTDNANSCIIVDPGSEFDSNIIEYLNERKLLPEYIILTHEHFDHIWSTPLLIQKFRVKVVCSNKCGERIIDKKKNMSLFYNQIGFELEKPDLIVKSLDVLRWNSVDFTFLETPGHTDSSISILVENNLLVGDLMIYGHKTVTKLPTGNKIDVINSLKLIYELVMDNTILVYPGHGDLFELNNISKENFIYE